MSAKNNHQFLLDVVSNAEDVKLLAEKFNLGLSDTVLRGGVTFDDRILIMFGSKTRNSMCEKKLPRLLDSSGIEYDPKKFVYLTADTLKSFVDKELAIIKGLVEEPKPIEYSPKEQEETSEEVKVELATEPKKVNNETTKEDEVHNQTENVVDVDEEETKDNHIEKDQSVGVCRYGVPKFKVEYQQPNVLGLKESLFVNVEQSTVQEFFKAVKDRAILNSDEGI